MTVPELGAATSTSSSVSPTRIVSPFEREVEEEMRFPFTKVPLEEPVSSISRPSPDGLTVACRREI
jgi:hypothetical protein